MIVTADRRPTSSLLAATGVAGVALVAGVLVSSPSGLRAALALAFLAPSLVVALRAPRTALYGLVVWFVTFGLVRRLTSGASPKEAWGDPLILVGATAWVVLLIVAVRLGGLRGRGRLTNSVLALWGLLALSALNPAQGGLTVGLGGALLVVVPMSAFVVGRALVDGRTFGRLLRLVAWLGIAAAIYGLIQTFVGFPSWDAAWIDDGGYTALNVGSVIRAFSSFSAASEYVGFLGLAVVAWVATAQRVRRWPVTAAALMLLATALWFASSRGIVVLTIVAVGAMFAARAGVPLWRAMVLGLVCLAALPTVFGWLAPARFSDDASGQLAQHQVEGLADPFGEDSTLPVHIALVRDGVTSAFESPLGTGVGAFTIAGGKFGGAVGGSEGDPGRAPFAAGLPGLIAYGAVAVFAVRRAYGLAMSHRDPLALAALGIVMVTVLQWLNGGHYAVMFWPWLALGWVDGMKRPSRTAPSAVVDGVKAQPPQQPVGRTRGSAE